MPPEPVPAEPEWDDDPAWSRPDPMTAAELKAGLDRVWKVDQLPDGTFRWTTPARADLHHRTHAVPHLTVPSH